METQGPSTSTSGDMISNRVAVYTKQFVKSFEKLISKCKTDADVGSTVEPSKTEKLAAETAKSFVSFVASTNPVTETVKCVAPFLGPAKLGQWASEGCETLLNSWFSKVRKEDYIRFVDRLRSLSKKELRKISVQVAVKLFSSFECQFMSVQGMEGSWEFDLEKLADDGAYRAINYLLKSGLVINEKV